MKSTKKTLSKALSVMIALVMAVTLSCSVFSVDTYAASPKTQVNNSVKKLMKGVKQCNEKNVTACLPKGYKAGYTDVKTMTPGMYKYIKKANNKMTYKITKTSVKKNTATVKVKITYADGTEYCQNVIRLLARGIVDGSIDTSAMDSTNLSNDDVVKMMKAYNPILGKASDMTSAKKMRTQTVTLKLKKSGKTWKLASKPSDAFTNIMAADISRAMQNMSEDDMMRIIMEEMYK